MKLTDCQREDNISTADFRNSFLRNNKPLIFKSFSKDWAATERWSFEYLSEQYGDVIVPLYLDSFAESGGGYMQAQKEVPFREYIEMLQSSDSRYRMFLYNILKHMPGLCEEFSYPDFANHFIKSNPFVFFGNQGSSVDVHFDADMSHVFLTQFSGKKTVILFPHDKKRELYQHPLTVSTNVDIANPDFERYPALKQVEGYRCELFHGDTLFIPSGWWHYIYYDEPSFSLSLRALSDSWLDRTKGVLNIGKLMLVDKNITRVLGSKRWYAKKENWAHKRAKKAGL